MTRQEFRLAAMLLIPMLCVPGVRAGTAEIPASAESAPVLGGESGTAVAADGVANDASFGAASLPAGCPSPGATSASDAPVVSAAGVAALPSAAVPHTTGANPGDGVFLSPAAPGVTSERGPGGPRIAVRALKKAVRKIAAGASAQGAADHAGRVIGDLFGGQGLGEETISDQESGEEEDHRIVEIDGKTYELGHADKWFYGLNERGGKWLNGDEIGLVKLHVLVDSPQDLARVQAALIPELMNAPYVAKFKTMDPLHWTSRADQALGDAPSGRGQGAKGITVYLEKPKKGLFVTRSGAHGILSDVVASNGLERRPVPGESVGKVDRTGRVVLVRDEFRRAIPSRLDNSGLYGGLLIDPIIARQIERESRKALRVDRRRKFTYDELRRIEQRLGLMSGTLVYGRLKGEPRNKARLMLTHGHTRQIEVSRKLAERLAAGKAPLEQDEYEYASEEREGRDFGELSGRFAMYALARRYGLDAADLAVESKQILIENSLEPGESVLLGRRTESMSDQEIEREHAVVGRDKKGRWYILNRDPAHGTWLEGPGGGKRRLKPNEKVLLGDHSKIIRGDYPNVSLGRWWLRWINVHRPD